MIAVALMIGQHYSEERWKTQDRDAWLFMHCDDPVGLVFIKNNGEYVKIEIKSISELTKFRERAKAAPNKYAINIKRNCGLETGVEK